MAFDFFPLPQSRIEPKPRNRGRTMMMDDCFGPDRLRDHLRIVGFYIDLAKFTVGSARLYTDDVLVEKLDIYREHRIETYVGGQFLEAIVHHQGLQMAKTYMTEARRLGFDAVEVSDNCIELSNDDRHYLVQTGLDAGLAVHGEVGSKQGKTDVDELIHQAELFIHTGCHLVVLEAAELVDRGAVDARMILRFKASLPMERVMIELPGSWISGVSLNDVFESMKTIVQVFGPDANIGNVAWDQVIELECMRCAIGTAGPAHMSVRT